MPAFRRHTKIVSPHSTVEHNGVVHDKQGVVVADSFDGEVERLVMELGEHNVGGWCRRVKVGTQCVASRQAFIDSHRP